jgi:hypothetical protein
MPQIRAKKIFSFLKSGTPRLISKALKTVSMLSSEASFITSALPGFSLTDHRLFISLSLKTVKINEIPRGF